MTKDEMITLLRSVGSNENTVKAMHNAFDMGVEYEREECAKVCESIEALSDYAQPAYRYYDAIRARSEA